jgi:hypothetical protein
MTDQHQHESRPAIVTSPGRARRHVRGVIAVIQDPRDDCLGSGADAAGRRARRRIDAVKAIARHL